MNRSLNRQAQGGMNEKFLTLVHAWSSLGSWGQKKPKDNFSRPVCSLLCSHLVAWTGYKGDEIMQMKRNGQLLCLCVVLGRFHLLFVPPIHKRARESHCASFAEMWKGWGARITPRAKNLITDNRHTKGEERSGPRQTEKLSCGFQCALEPSSDWGPVARE